MYATAGIAEYWIADPDRRTLTIFTLRDGEYDQVERSDDVTRSLAIPEFEVAIVDVFAGLKPDPED